MKSNTETNQYQTQNNQFSLSILLTILALVLVVLLSNIILKHATNVPSFAKERYIYLSCTFLLLPLCYFCTRVSLYVFNKWHKAHLVRVSITSIIISLWLLFWLSSIPTLSHFWVSILYGRSILHAPFNHPLAILIILEFLTLICCSAAVPSLIRNINATSNRSPRFFWIITLLLGSLLVGSQNVSGLTAVSIEAVRWYVNFEPVLYPLSQVLAGKTLLVDLPAQYGLYAELIAPIFKIIGFSISKVTFLFALMEALSYLALASVFLKLTKSVLTRVFWLTSSAILFGFTFQNYPSYIFFDPYYQYFPIRLFFPAISVFLFWQFISAKPRIRNAIGFSIFLTCGAIWNIDSGIPALGSFFVCLLLFAFFANKTERWEWIKIFIATTLGAATTLAVFAFYMTLKAGVPIPWNQWLLYQRLYYVTGLAAIPLPRIPHPWMAVIIIYILGIVGYMHFVAKRSNDSFWKMMSYLSILGLGLFAYYQHRAHDIVFLAVCWPALFIAFSCSDKFISYIVQTRLSKIKLIALLPTFVLGCLFCGFFLYKAPCMIGQANYNWIMAFSQQETPVTENIAYMRQRISPQDKNSVGIFSYHQSLYFSELGIASGLKGPGIREAMPNDDEATFIKAIHAAKPRVLFVQKEMMPLVVEMAKKEYLLIDESKNNMMYFHTR